MANTVYLGTEMKLNISIEPIGGKTMDDYDFVVEFYCNPSKKVAVKKNDMKREDNKNFIACLDTSSLGPGKLKCKVIAEIPDGDFKDDEKRTEVQVVETGIEIIKA